MCSVCKRIERDEDVIYKDRICTVFKLGDEIQSYYNECGIPNVKDKQWINLKLRIYTNKVFGQEHRERVCGSDHYGVEARPDYGRKLRVRDKNHSFNKKVVNIDE